jgi:subtilisin
MLRGSCRNDKKARLSSADLRPGIRIHECRWILPRPSHNLAACIYLSTQPKYFDHQFIGRRESMTQLRRYIVLPAFGFRSPALTQSALQMSGPVVHLNARAALRMRAVGVAARVDTAATAMQVLDSTHEDGPKLVEMSSEAELNLRAEIPGLKVVPLVTYQTMRSEQEVLRPAKAEATVTGAVGSVKVRIVDSKTQAAIVGAKVIGFTDFRNRGGAMGFTDPDGVVALTIKPGAHLDRLYVYGPARYWGHFSASQTTTPDMTVAIDAIDPAAPSLLLRRLYGTLPPDAGSGIRVAVVDTGVAMDHPALPNVTGGANLVFDEIRDRPYAAANWGPAAVKGGEHGTHVAGIIGARPTPALNLSGVAPGVEIRSYRVFPNNGDGATNYDILSAIDRAVSDGCHIVNLSLGGNNAVDEAVRAAIGAALNAGILVVAAAGNDYRKPVSFPASLDSCIAVSAMGRSDAFPPDSAEAAEIAKPSGTNPENFLAAFSNFGPQIDVTGPGVGIVSTLPGNTYGVMSGTSMACPAVVGFAAFLLAANPAIQAARGAERTRLWKAKLDDVAKPLGFGRDFEGFGLPSIALTS